MRKIFLIFTIAFCLAAFFAKAQVANQGDVVINEIAWAGSINSASDEWIELQNTTTQDISLEGWQLKSVDGKFHIQLSGTIGGRSYFLLERTDDTTIPNITADQIYKGALNNSGQWLKLYDNQSNFVDEASFMSGWAAGDSKTHQTMERISSGWQTSEKPGGSPRAQNSGGAIVISKSLQDSLPLPQKTPSETPLPIPTPVQIEKTYSKGIIINEIMPSPEGSDETNEWIELKNTTDALIDIGGWLLQDNQGTTTTHVFRSPTFIDAKGYIVIIRPQSKIILNNDMDGLELLWPNGQKTSNVSYENARANQSYAQGPDDWQWTNSPTPGTANIIATATLKTTPAKTTKAASLPKQNKSDTKASVATASLVDILPNQTEPETNNPWLLFIITGGLVATSIVVILIFKNFQHHVRT